MAWSNDYNVAMSLNRTGVYAIIHCESGRLYIGSSHDIRGRWRIHRSYLNRGQHHSSYLQRAWNKYGPDAFEFVVVRFCTPDDLIAEEQRWIDECDAAGRRGFNSTPTAGSTVGSKRNPETRAKIAAISKARVADPEVRAKISAVHKGKKLTLEHRAIISRSLAERVITPETRSRLSEAQKRRLRSPDCTAHLTAINKGRPLSTEHRAKLSEIRKGRVQSPEWIANRVAARKANKLRRLAMVQGELFT